MENASGGQLYDVESYFRLVTEGLLLPDEHVELLEGIVVSMPPQLPWHAPAVRRVDLALRRALGTRVLISTQLPFVASSKSVPEPDLALLPGRIEDYDAKHPTAALLVVEVAESSLIQDRLTKSRIYAGAGVPDYWIVNLALLPYGRLGEPDTASRAYLASGVASGATRLPLSAFPDAAVTAEELLSAR